MDQAREFLTHFTGPLGYLIFFFIIASCCVGFPFNSDLTFISASVLASLGYFQLWLLLLIGFFALLCGDSINFFSARRWGKKLLSIKPFSWVIDEDRMKLAETYLKTKGYGFIFLVRFIPLIRTVLYFTVGSLQVKPKTFYLMNAASTLIYLPLLMGSAFIMSSHIDRVLVELKRFQISLLSALALIGLFFFLKNKRKKPTPS